MSVSTTARLGYAVLGIMKLGDDTWPPVEDAEATMEGAL